MFSSLKKIFGRGLALAIPLAVVGYVCIRLVGIFAKVIRPVAEKIGIDRVLGELTLTIFAVLILLLLVFFLGLLMRISFIAGFGQSIDEAVTKLIPSINELKTMAQEKLNLENESGSWKAVLLLHQEKFLPAFVIEELSDLVTFYIVTGTSLKEGELLITSKNDVRYVPISAADMRLFSRQYGKGYLQLISQSGLVKQPVQS